MSPPFPEEPDPLLEFSAEPDAAPSAAPVPEPAGQPVPLPVDPTRPSAPSVPTELLVARVDFLERALEDSQKHVASLKSELATLVRVVGDIRKPASERPVVAAAAIVHGRRTWTASAIVGVLLGMAVAVTGWAYLSSDADLTIAPPVAAESAPSPITDPAPVRVASTVSETPKVSEKSIASEAPKPIDAPKTLAPKTLASKAPAPKAPKAPEAPRYVGTLSIDAEPGGDVFIDRQSAGHTPLRVTNLRAGSHLVWIEREGYHRFTRVVLVPSDRVSRLSAELEPIASR